MPGRRIKVCQLCREPDPKGIASTSEVKDGLAACGSIPLTGSKFA